jgi:LacI family transcriptional regulator
MPDGVFCFNDVIAMGIIAGAQKQAVRVPEELAVIGCGNLHYDSDIRVPLSSIDQRSDEIGNRVATLILELLSDEERNGNQQPEFKETILKPRLVARASTARPPIAKKILELTE